MQGHQAPESTHSRNVALLALCVGVVLMLVKFIAYWLTDSAAVLSDALESIVNVFASGFALFSIMLSARPPDSSHPYGHGRVEFFSAGLEGTLIIAAAAIIFWHAVPRLFEPQAISHPFAGHHPRGRRRRRQRPHRMVHAAGGGAAISLLPSLPMASISCRIPIPAPAFWRAWRWCG